MNMDLLSYHLQLKKNNNKCYSILMLQEKIVKHGLQFFMWSRLHIWHWWQPYGSIETSSQKQNQPIPVFYLIYTKPSCILRLFLWGKILLLVWYQNKTHEMTTPLLLPMKVYSANNYIAFNLMQQAESFIWITSISKLTIYTQLSPSFATKFEYKMHINSFTYYGHRIWWSQCSDFCNL